MRIALAGNPNCGKTTMYNALTGKNEKVGNWAGVTVSSKESGLKSKYDISGKGATIVDLPGAYSITPYTSEEGITKDFILEEKPDVIINIVDGANVERSLLFTSQLMELGIPMIIALNKADIIKKRKDIITVAKLSKVLGIEIVETTATEEQGLKELVEKAAKGGSKPNNLGNFASTEDRQRYISEIIKEHKKQGTDLSKQRFSDKLDRIFAHKIIGIPIFFLIIWAIYSISIQGIGLAMSDYINEELFGEIVPTAATEFLEGLGASEFWVGFLVDGVIAGVGAVLGFLPLIMMLFFFLALLEDSGYMARVAVLMDKYFKKIGLSGKSIIPMIVGTGCSIPGVMSTRTIENEQEKKITAILAPLVPCGAKLPVIALFSAVFFADASWVAPSIYILSFVLIILGGWLLKNISGKTEQSTFILELPEYKIPSIKFGIIQMFDKAWAFIVKAVTIIMLTSIFVWFAQGFTPTLAQAAEDQSDSILALIGHWVAPILIPMGIVSWQLATAALTGFIAKETVVSTLGVLFAAGSEEAVDIAPALEIFLNPVTAYAFLAFNLFIPPCFAAIGAMNSEIKEKKWLLKGVLFQIMLGTTVAILISQIGSLIVYGQPATGFIPAVVILVLIFAYTIYLIKKAKSKA